jgi:hypothetical protein
MPMSCRARTMRRAISPRLATRIFKHLASHVIARRRSRRGNPAAARPCPPPRPIAPPHWIATSLRSSR